MKIHHIAITVNNLEESQKFYQDFFNFKISKSFERKDLGAKIIFIELEGFFIELWEFADFKKNDGDLKEKKIIGIRHVAFEVENLDKIFSDFKLRGLEMTEPKLGASGRMYSFISDPNGVPLEIYQR
jgi:catechol 2,3-dioxygenase-like lactoylglutathione lyase family enzyme